MGTFNNVTLGNGALTYDGVDVGFLKGNVEYTYSYDILKFKTGAPLRLRGQITKELTSTLKAGIAELSADNIAMALGGLSISTTTASPVTVNDAANAEFTFVAGTGPLAGLQYFQLAPGVVISGVSSITVENTAEDTTYTAETDYLVFPTSGVVVRVPGGSIASGATVRVQYTYTPVIGKRINLGTSFSLAQKPITFTHTRPQTGYDVIVHMPLASIDGRVALNFDEENFIVNDVTFEAIEDTSGSPTYPMGYIHIETGS